MPGMRCPPHGVNGDRTSGHRLFFEGFSRHLVMMRRTDKYAFITKYESTPCQILPLLFIASKSSAAPGLVTHSRLALYSAPRPPAN